MSKPDRPSARSELRLSIILRPDDDPLLFQVLSALPKGLRRITRLRLLAHDGLMLEQQGGIQIDRPGPCTRAQDSGEPGPVSVPAISALAQAAAQLFGEPIKEEG